MRYSASEARALNCRRVLTETQSYERRLTKNILKDIATVSPTLEDVLGTGLPAFASGPILKLWRGARLETGNPDWDLSKLGSKLHRFRRRKGASD